MERLTLNGKSERSRELYRRFIGHYKEQMPLLISGRDANGNIVDVPRLPISFAQVIERRETAPADVIEAWRKNTISTGDGVAYGTQGDVLIALDAQPLREINAESRFADGALILSNDQWSNLKARKDVLSLTWDEIDEANGLYGTGYIKKDGVWVPANKTVAKIFDYLGRGRNLKEYAQLMGDYCNVYPTENKDVMRLIFSQSYRSDDHSEEIFPILRCWTAGHINDGGLASDDIDLDSFSIALLMGIAPNSLVTFEGGLEARLATFFDASRNDKKIYTEIGDGAKEPFIFSGQSERLPKLYRELRGPYKEQMSLLISGRDADGNIVDVPRLPISFAHVIERLETAPADVIKEWQKQPISTGDGVVYGPQGVLIVLDAKPLREINSESNFDEYDTLILSDKQCRYSSLSEKEGIYSLSLTYDEVEEINNGGHGTGYIKKSGEWVPANKTAAKIWDHLSRGQNPKLYAQLVAEHSRKIYGHSIESEGVMKISFHGSGESYPPVVSYWIAVSIDGCGDAIAHPDFDNDGSCLVGVIPPSLVTCEKTLEARLATPPNAGRPSVRETFYESLLRKIRGIK